MVTINDEYCSMTIRVDDDAVVINMSINQNGDLNNLVAFHFDDGEIFEKCRSLFKSSFVRWLNDKETNLELEVGCTDVHERFVYFELVDNNSKDTKPSSYIFKIPSDSENYDLFKGLVYMIEKAKEKEAGANGHKFNHSQHKG